VAAATNSGFAVQPFRACATDLAGWTGGSSTIDVAFIAVLDAVIAGRGLTRPIQANAADAVAPDDAESLILTSAVGRPAAARNPTRIGIRIAAGRVIASVAHVNALTGVTHQRLSIVDRRRFRACQTIAGDSTEEAAQRRDGKNEGEPK
jgi:hypothetical protein